MRFRFLDPGPLIDGELELICPEPCWIDETLAASGALISADANANRLTRRQLEDFLRIAPKGQQSGDLLAGTPPACHFWMRLRPAPGLPLPNWASGRAGTPPPMPIAGGLGLRIGRTPDIEFYLGNVGYNVHPFARGNHYAERACRLIRPLAIRYGLPQLWITCNPDNAASRRTCERLGCTLVETVPLPATHPLRQRGDREKCRYRWDL